jgi:exodeoxyribonuclease VII small subunit
MAGAEGASLEGLSFEAALARLETIVRQLEAGEVDLEASIDLYEQGQALKAFCEAKLKAAQARIEQIQLGPDGQPRGTRPFDAE